MKKLIVVLLIVAIAVGIVAIVNNSKKKSTGEIMADWLDRNADPKMVNQISNAINDSRASRASRNGDTYCKNCDRYIEGKVRICPYCGQYIK